MVEMGLERGDVLRFGLFWGTRKQGQRGLQWVPVGEVAERLKAHDWNSCMAATSSGVRIPLSPLEPRSRFWDAVFLCNYDFERYLGVRGPGFVAAIPDWGSRLC